ncbi:hypothetical protein C4N9_06210 [Pararhodobacter marinus]|uniref:HTH cro/C1-type domain-containing protein n=1 Tax=Pararhodobacter marinus TaxID=2184063 RepID=A0A2U2CEJ6_9RHOB|nr:hypothetical protein [Pararhodobacter marinus]PWE30280.1 hypothetical protein C4N9_06210 [Pararhodobacter marinus]
MSKAGEIPYTWKQIEDQVREAILCQASILETFGPWQDQNLVADYLCLDRDSFRGRSVEDVRSEELDISEHQMLILVKAAYNYAYQLDGASRKIDSEWHDVGALMEGFPQTDANGEPSPFCMLNDFPLRRMLETFYARFALYDSDEFEYIEYQPSIRELSLLANMTVPAVRTSLSKEGFKLEKVQRISRGNQEEASFRLNTADARLWLSRRRGFIPQRSQDLVAQMAQIISMLLTDKSASFPELLSRLLDLRQIKSEDLASEADLDPAWLSDLTTGAEAAPDIEALRRLANALELPEPEFAAAAVSHLVSMMRT